MVMQFVSREQVDQMRDGNQTEINNIKAQIYNMEVQGAASASQSKALRSAAITARRKQKELITRAKRLDKLLREGKVTTGGQTFIVQ